MKTAETDPNGMQKVGLAQKVWQTETTKISDQQCIKIWVELVLEAPKLTAAASAYTTSKRHKAINQTPSEQQYNSPTPPKTMSVIQWLAKKQEAKFACCCIYSSITPSGSGKQHLQCRLWMCWVLAAKVRFYSSERLLNYTSIFL